MEENFKSVFDKLLKNNLKIDELHNHLNTDDIYKEVVSDKNEVLFLFISSMFLGFICFILHFFSFPNDFNTLILIFKGFFFILFGLISLGFFLLLTSLCLNLFLAIRKNGFKNLKGKLKSVTFNNKKYLDEIDDLENYYNENIERISSLKAIEALCQYKSTFNADEMKFFIQIVELLPKETTEEKINRIFNNKNLILNE